MGQGFTCDGRQNLTDDGPNTFAHAGQSDLGQGAGSGAGRFQYDGDRLSAVYDASGAMVERYVAGPGVDGWAVTYAGSGFGSPRWPLQDAQGSVIALTDASGTAVATLA